MREIIFALRSVSRTPALSLLVILSLGLGIGGNTAVFSMLNQILLAQLPVANPGELVMITSPGNLKGGRTSSNSAGGMDSVFSYPMFRGLERQPQGLIGVAGFRTLSANLSLDGKTQNASVNLVSGQYFPLLGVTPLVGRMLEPADDQGAGRPVVVLSHAYWQDRLGADSAVLNRPLRVNGELFTIVGIAPANFLGTTFGDVASVYVPMVFKKVITPGWDGRDRWDDYWIYLFGRLQPGASRQQAAAALNSTFAPLIQDQAKLVRDRDEKYMTKFRSQSIGLEDFSQGNSDERREARTPLLLLMAVTVLVLLIAAANAANLLLARAAQRQRELAIRVAIGAGQGAIIRQLLYEALALALGAALAGLLIGAWTLNLLVNLTSNGDPQSRSIRPELDPVVLAFTLLVAVVTGLLFGLYPAWVAARDSMGGGLKDESNASSGSQDKARVRRALVAAQVGISMALLIPMGLFLKSMVNLTRVNTGLRTANTLTFQISPRLNQYTPQQTLDLTMRAEEALAAIPGVQSVTTAMVPLIAGNNWGNTLTVEGSNGRPVDDMHSMFNEVGPGFLGKMGIALVAGREFTDRDTAASPKVALVSETFVRHFFPGGNAIGKKFAQGWGKGTVPDIEIVGVVKDTKYSSVRQAPPRLYYRPYRQNKDLGSMTFYVRTVLPVEQLAPDVRRVMSSLDRDLPLERFRTLEDQIKQTLRSDRLVLQLTGAFAVLATVLAMLGLYGVTAYGVARRTREIGIRMALGAAAATIRFMVLREVLLVLAIGVAVGAPLAYFLSRAAESQLFGVKAFDPVVLTGTIAAVLLAGALAGFLPARKASRLNPTQALRWE